MFLLSLSIRLKIKGLKLDYGLRSRLNRFEPNWA
ncbi:unnamed protein product [Arabidopsis halleri]